MKLFLSFVLCISFSLISIGQSNKGVSCEVTAPTTVTLDCGDGLLRHDYQFRVRSTCLIEGFKISLYDRWGELLYLSNDINEYWDASEIAGGTYYYVVQGMWEDGIEVNEARFVTVLK